MKTDKNYTFSVSISKDRYRNKQQATAAIVGGEDGRLMRKNCGLSEKIGFQTTSVTAEELLYKVLSGYTFCSNFSGFPEQSSDTTYVRKDRYFTLSGKSSRFFAGSYFIGVDIDDTDYDSPQEFISKLELEPTFWYTSLSHQQIDESTEQSKGVRMRLIYVFDECIRNPYFFRYCSYNLHQIIEENTQEKIKDKCGLVCTQYFNGTNINDESIKVEYGISDVIYSLSDIQVTLNDFHIFIDNNCYYKSIDYFKKKDIQELKCLLFSHSLYREEERQTAILIVEREKSKRSSNLDIQFDYRLVNDVMSMDEERFYKVYSHRYKYIYRTEKEDWLSIQCNEQIVEFQYCDEDYLELLWIPKRITDGHHRKLTLYHRGWLRRIINPEITPDELLFNLIIDCNRFIDNSFDKITISQLKHIVKRCFLHEIEEYEEMHPYIIESTRHNCKSKQVIIRRRGNQQIRANSLLKELRWQYLDQAYNRELNVKENLDLLNDEDFSISKCTLYRYCESRGIETNPEKSNKYNTFVALHQENMSRRDEITYLKYQGLKISIRTLTKYIQRYCKNIVA